MNLVTDLKLELFGVALSCTSEEQEGIARSRLRKLSLVPNFSFGIKNRRRKLAKKFVSARRRNQHAIRVPSPIISHLLPTRPAVGST